MRGVLKKATSLEEFGGGTFNTSEQHVTDTNMSQMITFPPKLKSLLGLKFMMEAEIPAIFPRASVLKKITIRKSLSVGRALP